MRIIDEPYTARVCNHSFSKAVIEMVKDRRNNGQIECPVAGCNKYIKMADLFLDKRLKKRIERYLELEQEQAQEETGGEFTQVD